MSSYFQMPGRKPKKPVQQASQSTEPLSPAPIQAPPQLPAGALQDEAQKKLTRQIADTQQISDRGHDWRPSKEETPVETVETVEPVETVDPNEQRFRNLMTSWEESGENIGDIALAQESAAGRRAAEMNAALGRGMGGGFAGGMAQASLTGQRERLSLEQEHQERGLELQMTHLQDLLKQAEAAKDRDLQLELQDKIGMIMMQLEAVRSGADVPSIDPETGEVTTSPRGRWDDAGDINSSMHQSGGWNDFRDYNDEMGWENAYYSVTNKHMNESLASEEGDARRGIDVINDLKNTDNPEGYNWDDLSKDQQMQMANWVWGYYLREGVLPSYQTVGEELYHRVDGERSWESAG